MANVILTGATGTAGKDTLINILKSPRVAQVTVLSRRPLEAEFQNHPKIKFIEHKDFNAYPENLLSQLKGNSACIWCLGVSSVGMKEDDYRVITRDYALSAAKAFSSLADHEFRFVFLSGEGAAWKPGMLTQMFGRVKGQAEEALAALSSSANYGNLVVHSARPAFIRPTNPKDGLPFGMKALKTVFNPSWTPKAMVIESSQLGTALLKLAVPTGKKEKEYVSSKGGPEERGVWNNVELLKLATMHS